MPIDSRPLHVHARRVCYLVLVLMNSMRGKFTIRHMCWRNDLADEIDTHTHRIVTLIAERFLIHSSSFILMSSAAAFIVLYAMRNIHISHQRSIVAFIYVSQSLTIALKRLLTLATSIGSMQQSKWKMNFPDTNQKKFGNQIMIMNWPQHESWTHKLIYLRLYHWLPEIHFNSNNNHVCLQIHLSANLKLWNLVFHFVHEWVSRRFIDSSVNFDSLPQVLCKPNFNRQKTVLNRRLI